MVGEDGLVEIKCPMLSTAVSYLVNNELPSDYYQQVQGQMLVTGRKYCDFVSYFPRHRTFVKRVERNDEFCKKLHIELVLLVKTVDSIVNKIK
jgi:predicted phage-related endonuclease